MITILGLIVNTNGGGDACDHLMIMRTFTSIANEIFISAPKIIRKWL